jgi:Fe-S-cluster containining protein
MFNQNVVEPTRLEPGSRFKFRCHPKVPCFTKCCSNIDIMLTPYDVLRLKNRLGMTSDEFLEKHTLMRTDDKSNHLYAYLKMDQGEDKRCPFLKSTTEGCAVYEDRPVSCRYYPIGRGMVKTEQKDGSVEHEEFCFFVREEHCKGYEEPDEWTVESWRKDQDAEHYDEMNKEWKELLMRRDLPGQPKLSENKQMQFFMASYDLDRFRAYVLESRFLDAFDIPEAEVKAMREDEVALMKFGPRYLKFLMGIEETLKLKGGAGGAAGKSEAKE